MFTCMLRAFFYLVPLDLMTPLLFAEEQPLRDFCNCCVTKG
jgi:hypothetical protein